MSRTSLFLKVPGDVLDVSSVTGRSSKIPCDCCLISGSVVVDEAMLTGEAFPVNKIAITAEDAEYHPDGQGKIHTLFAGTTALETGFVDQIS